MADLPIKALDELQEAHEKATPGPWQWYGNTKQYTCYLSTVHGGRVFVMQFDRWGFGSAQPTFQRPVGAADGSGTGLMYPLSKLPEEAGPDFEVDYRRDFVGIKHPDAQIICKSRNALPSLLAMARRTLEAEAKLSDARVAADTFSNAAAMQGRRAEEQYSRAIAAESAAARRLEVLREVRAAVSKATITIGKQAILDALAKELETP